MSFRRARQRQRQVLQIFFGLVSLTLCLLLLGSASAQQQQPPPGVYSVVPDPAEVEPGGQVNGTIDVRDDGVPSCLFGLVPTGFSNPFNPPIKSPLPPPGVQRTTWTQNVTLTVDSNVAAGNYAVVLRVRPQSRSQCTNTTQQIGSDYSWDFIVRVPPSPTPSPTPNAGALVNPKPSPSPSPSPSPLPSPLEAPPPLSIPELASGEVDKSMTTLDEPGIKADETRRPSFVLAVDSFGDSIFDPKKLAVSLGLAVILTLLIAFPGELFAKTWQENTARIRNALGFLKSRRKGLLRRLSRSWIGFVLVLPITAVLYAVLSLDFGLNTQTLVLVLGMFGSIALIIGANELTAALYIRRRHDRVYLRVFPGTLAIAVACVAVSRLVGFEPGYLYGLVAGAAFRGSVDDRTQGKAVAIASISLLTVSLGAWVGWQFIEPAAAQSGAPIGLLVLEALLVATFVAGLEALLFGLLPMTFLDGQKLRSWNRLVWAVLFGLTTFLFVHLVLNPETSYVGFSRDTPTLVVIALFLGFGLFSVGFWAYFRFVPARKGATSN